MIENRNGVPKILDSCYLYNDSFEMIHGSISETKNYLKESWRYRINKNHPSKKNIS